MCTSVIPLQSKGSVTSLTLYERKNSGMDLDEVGEAVCQCAPNGGDTSVDNQSGCDWDTVLHVF